MHHRIQRIAIPVSGWVAACIGLLMLASPCPAAEFSIRVWRSDAGLPDNRVTGIVQGPLGYIWVSTYDGLCRFDGIRFQRVPLPEVPGTPHSLVRAMLLGRRGSLWLALEGGVAMKVSKGGADVEVFTNDLPNLAALSIAQDSGGAVWISYLDGSVRRLEGDRVSRYAAAQGLPASAVPSWLTSDSSGQIWLTKAGQLGVFRGEVFVALHEFEETQALRLSAARSEGVWLRVGRDLVRFNPGAEPEAVGRLPSKAKGLDPSVLFEDRDGAVWIGTASSGLFRYADGTFTKVATSHPEIRTITQDREGTIWVGTGGGGVNRLRPSVIELQSRESGLPFEVAQSVCQDTRGTLWVALQNGTVARLTASGWVTLVTNDAWPANDATCLAAEPRGGIWIGTRTHGLYHYEDDQFQHWDRTRGLASDYVRSLLVDAADNLWVGQHWSSCVQRFSQGQFHEIPLPPSSKAVRAMTQDAEGAIWAGNAAGNLYRIQNDRLSEETGRTLAGRHPIRSLQSTPDGSVWIGYAGAGLGWIRTNRFIDVGQPQGLAQEDVSQIVPDAEGNLWLAGNRGISQLRREDLEALAAGRLARIQVLNYGPDEGFPSLQGNYGFTPGGIRSRDGRIWLSMRTGLAVVNTSQVVPNLIPPPVLIEHLWVDGLAVPLAPAVSRSTNGGPGTMVGTIHLTPQHRKVEFDFTALSFIAPESIRFRYRLDGLDDAWSSSGTARSVVYPRLPAGAYRFRVIACNNSGVWNERGAALNLKVAPFFWQTWRFRITALAAFTLAVAGVVRYASFRRLRRQLQRLQQESVLHNERARIARDIHDDLGANLTQIALLSELAREDLERPQQAGRQMEMVAGQARQVIKTLDEIVWAVNPRNDTLAHLLDYIGQFAIDFLSTARIRCRVNFPQQPPDRALAGEDRHNLFLVLKEALNNVVKHAHASEVRLSAEVDPGGLSLSVEDDGQGLGEGAKDAWADGLRNMRQRLAAIGAAFEVEGRPEHGTRIGIRFPWPKD